MANYFNKFPDMIYKFEGADDLTMIDNLLIRFGIIDEIKEMVGAFEYYTVKEGESPQEIAFLLYDDATLHWIIYMMNDIQNPDKEWPMDFSTLLAFMDATWGDDIDAVHHYENADGDVVDSDAAFATPVTNRGYEDAANDAKRRIKLIMPEFVGGLVSEFKQKISLEA